MSTSGVGIAQDTCTVRWESIVQVTSDSNMTTSPQIVVQGDTVYLVWWNHHLQDTPESSKGIFMIRSIDGGATFSVPKQILTFGDALMLPARLMATGAHLYLLHYAPLDTFPYSGLVIDRSTDAGETWIRGPVVGDYEGRSFVSHDSSVYVSVTYLDTVLTGGYQRLSGYYVSHDFGVSYARAGWGLQADNGNPRSGFGTLLYLNGIVHELFSIRFPMGPISVYEVGYRRSTDQGKTWSTSDTLSVADSLLSTAPWIATDREGNIHAVWYDHRYGSIDDYHGGIVIRTSSDGGITWKPEYALSAEPTGLLPIIESNGSLTVIAWDKYVDYNTDQTAYRSSSDGGRTWSYMQTINDSGFSCKVGVLQSRMIFAWWWRQDLYRRNATFLGLCVFPPFVPLAELEQNFSNPFNGSTVIRYSVPAQVYVSVVIYDLLGRDVRRLVQELKEPGEYSVTWDASNVPSGVYFYRLVAGGFVETKKMVLMR